MITLFGFQLHWGEPRHPTKIRAYTGAMSTREPGLWSLRFTDHEIVRWYGVSFKLAGFFGWQRFGETNYPSENGSLPNAQEEKAQ